MHPDDQIIDGSGAGPAPFCPACGAASSSGAQFCTGCGRPVPAAADGGPGSYSRASAWTPAARIPAFRGSLRRWLLPAGIVIVVVALLAINLPLSLGGRSGVPVVDTHVVSAYPADLAGRTSSDTILPGEGGAVGADGVEVRVPPAAVVEPTIVTITRVSGPYESAFGSAGTPATPAEGGAATAWALSPVFDVGPAGTEFREPVSISIRYDEGALPEGMSESQVAVAYFNGENWVSAPALVDQAANTATFALERFEGTYVVVIVVGAVIGLILNRAIVWWYGSEGVASDPISEGRAAEWVVPRDPVVVEWGGRAWIAPNDKKNGPVPLTDPAVVGWAASGRQFKLSFKRSGGEPIRLAPRSTTGPGTNWQKPADYFVKNDLRGDCTDVTNAWVSVLRSQDYRAKGVFGYAVDDQTGTRTPHVWAEVLVGGKPFLLDEGGVFWPLDEGMDVLKLVRAGPDDTRNAMWDENKQERYRERWWESPEESAASPSPTPGAASPSPTPFEGGQVPIEPGWELAATVQASDPSDPGDRRLYVTVTHPYEFEDRKAVTIAVFEYRYVNGQLAANPSERIFFTDVPLNADVPGDPVADALASAAEWTAKYIAEQGLKVDSPAVVGRVSPGGNGDATATVAGLRDARARIHRPGVDVLVPVN